LITPNGEYIMSLTPAKQRFVDLASTKYGIGANVNKEEVFSVVTENKIGWPSWFTNLNYRVDRGEWKLPTELEIKTGAKSVPLEVLADEAAKAKSTLVPDTATNLMMTTDIDNMVPDKFAGFVSWGYFKEIKSIIKSKLFYPIFVTGLSGNGKTLNVQEACAELGRECVRVNVTIETDEDDLIGGFRLVDGETKFNLGPVAIAMERGAVLLLDEVDLASNKIMCLQPVLEGNGIYVKKINRYIKPAKGFTVIATANTKGRGSDDGKFIGTNILNEAFLERFPITMEQPYPALSVEKKIVLGSMEKYGVVDEDFADKLVTWAEVIRKTYFEGAVDELISTRRLDHIVKAFTIFKDKLKAIEMCTNRFDEDTKVSFVDLYAKVDAGVDLNDENSEEESEEEENSDMPY
jgi:MoxR-like ATPase